MKNLVKNDLKMKTFKMSNTQLLSEPTKMNRKNKAITDDMQPPVCGWIKIYSLFRTIKMIELMEEI